jgi:hypothetical protein
MRVIQMHAGTGIVRMGVQDLREIKFAAGERTVTVDDVIQIRHEKITSENHDLIFSFSNVLFSCQT